MRDTNLIDSAHHWNVLLYKEALYIKRRAPGINVGLKYSKELRRIGKRKGLFSY